MRPSPSRPTGVGLVSTFQHAYCAPPAAAPLERTADAEKVARDTMSPLLQRHATPMERATRGPGLSSPVITIVRIMDRLNVGGPAIHAALTTQGLDPERFRTILVIGEVERGEGDMSYLIEQYGLKDVVSIPSLGRELRPLRDLVTLWHLVQVIRTARPDVVHTHKAKAGALGRMAAYLCGVQVRVHTFHGHVLSGYFGRLKSNVFASIERTLARSTTKLVAPSARVADELSSEFRIGKRSQYEVVPLGFDLAPFASNSHHKGALRRELKCAPAAKLVGIVGRMVPVKDHATFIAAAAQLAAQDPHIQFVLIGGGELEGAIRADVEHRQLGHRTHFLGWRQDMPRIYADLDVMALSSINEGTPVTLIEAMAAAVPVVATNVGGVADVLLAGRRGELVSARSPAALAAGITKGLTPQAKERALQVQADVLDDYGSQRLCHDLERLYTSLVPGKTRDV